jgi:hypothetical protein
MMTLNEPTTEIIQGQYWRALQAIPEQAITEGMVLLLQSIRDVDNTAHTVILRPHPSLIGRHVNITRKDGSTSSIWDLTEHRFLVSDFLLQFALEDNYQSIRRLEIEHVQHRLGELQEEMINPQKQQGSDSLAGYLTSGMTKWDTENGVDPEQAVDAPIQVSTALTVNQVEKMKVAAGRTHQLATLTATWTKQKVQEIAETVGELTPFYQEQAAAALARTEDVRRKVSGMQKGIESLDLYVGTNVNVETLRTGESASEKLTIAQRKLYADEELSVYADVNENFDADSLSHFLQVLARDPRLVNQIFPSPRSVVAIAPTRRRIDYKDVYTHVTMSDRNKRVGLLVRNGDNLYFVQSSIDSHIYTSNLIPSKADLEAIFRTPDLFSDKGEDINFMDVRYTDSLETHERFALHYKRFMILLAGLDHRLNLFGDFYTGPKDFSFVSQSFQAAYMRFIHDEDGERMLPVVSKPPLNEWIETKNAYLRSGARVFCLWNKLATSNTAPGLFGTTENRNGDRWCKVDFLDKASMKVAAMRDGDLFVSTQVQHRHTDRKYTAQINLSKFHDYGTGYLVLDAITADELEGYIYDRDARVNFLTYIKFFKLAVAHLRDEEKQEAASRRHMLELLKFIFIPTFHGNADQVVSEAVIGWRAANRGKALPSVGGNKKDWADLYNLMYTLAERISIVKRIVAWLRDSLYSPLRLVITGKNKLTLYVAPNATERDDRLSPHIWVKALPLTLTNKGGVVAEKSAWVVLPKHSASETTLHEWSQAKEWAEVKPLPFSLEDKRQAFSLASNWQAEVHAAIDPQNFERMLERWKYERHQGTHVRKSTRVFNPLVSIGIGTIVNRKSQLEVLTISTTSPEQLLYSLAPTDEDRKRVRDAFIKDYHDKQSRAAHFDANIGDVGWFIGCVDSTKFEPGISPVWVDAIETPHSRSRSLDSCLARAVEGMNRPHSYTQAEFSLAEGIDGHSFDPLLGINPGIKTIRATLYSYSGGDDRRPKYENWADIVETNEAGQSKAADEAKKELLGKLGGSSLTCLWFFTKREVYDFLLAEGYSSLNDPEAFHPTQPEVERWFMNVEG